MRKSPVGQRRISDRVRRISTRPRLERIEERVLLSSYSVTSTADTNTNGTLRFAINQVDSGTGSGDTIQFKIVGGGLQTIQLGSALPALTKPVTIDGTTESGYAGLPLIEISGAGLPAGTDGLAIHGGSSKVIGLAIDGFSGNAITISSNGSNSIEGDFLGTNPAGTAASANGGDGLLIVDSSGNQVGGTLANQQDVISGNGSYGIELKSTSVTPIANNTIINNLIGTDITGKIAIANTKGGIHVGNGATATTIGGTTASERNLISGNSSNGIDTFGTTDGTQVTGNFIGTDISGSKALPNLGDGVHLVSSNNTIGGPIQADGNVIAFNGNNGTSTGAGVAVVANALNDAILSNSIFGNVGLGIDLGGTGNKQQAAPNLSAASSDNKSTTIVGSLTGDKPSTTYTVQFFSDPTADPSGFGQGQTFLGSASITTGPAGTIAFSQTINGVTPPGSVVTATATDPNGNTSGFAKDVSSTGTADLAISIAPSATSAHVGDSISYTVTVKNNGPTLARGVTVIDTLPAGVSITSGPTVSQGSVTPPSATSFTANLGTVLSGDSATITFTVLTTTATGSAAVNSAVVSSQEGDPIAGNNTATATTTLTPVADLAVAMQGPPTILAGGQLSYTVSVTNTGPQDATNVVLTDTLPAGATFSSISPSTGATENGQVVTVAIGTITANSAPVVFTIVATTAPTIQVSSLTNTAGVTETEFDPTPADNTATTTTAVIPVADLVVAVTGTPSTIKVNQGVTYTATVTNDGPSTATGVVLTDLLPANVSVLSVSDSIGGTPIRSGSTITDTIPSLASGGKVTLTILIGTSPATAATITDTASAALPPTESDPNPANNVASTSTTVQPVVGLAVSMSGTPSTVQVGQNVTYLVTVTNSGPSPATGVTLVDALPPSVTLLSAVASQGTVTGSSGVFQGNIGTVPAGGSATMTLVVTTSASSVPSITNTVNAIANEAPKPTTATATTVVTPIADLAVAIKGPNGPVTIGQQVTYIVSVKNNGPSSASNIVLLNQLPQGAVLVAAQDSQGGVPTLSNGTLTDPLGSLAPTATDTLTIVIAPAGPGTLVDSATVSAREPDSNPANNVASLTTNVLPLADLAVSLAADQAQVTTGNNLTFTATVSNNGPSPATGVILTETLPAGAQVVAVSQSQGGAAIANGVLSAGIGTLAPNASATVTIVVIPSIPGTTTDSATVAGSQLDPNLPNNSATLGVTTLQPPGTLQFSASGYTVNEDSGTATILVTRTNGAQGTVSVNYATVANGSGTPGVDFNPVSGTLVFPQGQTTATFTVPVLANPFDNRDETVGLVLGGPNGGAVLGPQSSATLVIHDIDPDFVPPAVLSVRYTGTAKSIQQITMLFSKPLDPASAMSLANYHLVLAGTNGQVGGPGSAFVGIQSAVYNPATGTVTITPAGSLLPNRFYYLTVNGVTDRAGNLLAGATGAAAGSGYATYFARGVGLDYLDSRGTAVALTLKGGGVMDLTRSPNGEGQVLQILNPIAGKSVLTGRTSGAATTFQSINGLGLFGQVRVDMTTPPIYVANLPFNQNIVDPPAVDAVLASGGVHVPLPKHHKHKKHV